MNKVYADSTIKISKGDFEKLEPANFSAEWKWDGIRVQVVSDKGVKRLYSRTGDDISGTFPDILEAMDFEGTLDGELLVRRRGLAQFAIFGAPRAA